MSRPIALTLHAVRYAANDGLRVALVMGSALALILAGNSSPL
jgi:hypothetical protein